MGRLLDENNVYALFAPNGTARLNVADIDVLPRVGAVEVVHGRWIDTPDEMTKYKCDNPKCGFPSFVPWNYCPNCGAKMGLED